MFGGLLFGCKTLICASGNKKKRKVEKKNPFEDFGRRERKESYVRRES